MVRLIGDSDDDDNDDYDDQDIDNDYDDDDNGDDDDYVIFYGKFTPYVYQYAYSL